MKVRILTVGKLKEASLRALEEEYLKRLPRYLQVDVEELKAPQASSEEQQKEREGHLILSRLNGDEPLIALSEEGEMYTSQRFSTLLTTYLDSGCTGLSLVIGGAFGLSKAVKERAGRVLSLSKFTFPHQLARVILIEQIYRASTLRDNIPYHK